MADLSLQQVLELRDILQSFNSHKDTYMDLYRKIVKKHYTTELNNLIQSEFNILDAELNVPKIPPLSVDPEDYSPMFHLSKLEEIYEATKENLSWL
ncbi:uncharacterized protein LOC110188429 [Drosophila serrata]|uniref:uncharacterized protein LOC110188429 n=1 Tax=Drosophila serrata TaxID=7274 RepID=UPI000A1D18DD|nr:uncharacterized protein LOC110188429 [Drosophila serrata]